MEAEAGSTTAVGTSSDGSCRSIAARPVPHATMEPETSAHHRGSDATDAAASSSSSCSSSAHTVSSSSPSSISAAASSLPSSSTSSSSSEAAAPVMSKNAMKRLKKAEELKRKRRYQRQLRKERQKKARHELKLKLQQQGGEEGRGEQHGREEDEDEEEGEGGEGEAEEKEKQGTKRDGATRGPPPPELMSKWKKKKQMQLQRVVLPQRVVIDCSFDALMTEREVISFVNQLARCYSCNNSSAQCVQLSFTSFGGNTKERCKVSVPGYENWTNIKFESKSYLDLFQKEELVYLTSESPNTIDTLDDNKVYIIGGLVDHNRLKGITYKMAQEQGIATAQLPIGEYLRMSSRRVLAVNHVFEILLRFKQTGDWGKTLIEVIPQRKGAKSKSAQEEEEENAEQVNDQSQQG